MRNLRSVNLNLLPILRELIRTQNVTHAAQTLNMSQPAVSHALSRLRVLLNDEILVSSGRERVLSSYAQRLAPIVEDVLLQIEAIIRETPLDIMSEHGVIKIATADYIVEVFGPKLLQKVAERAPGMTVQLVNWSSDTVQQLQSGTLDFAITPGTKLPDTMALISLFEDEAVCIAPVDSDYGDKLSYDEFWSARHVAYTPGDTVFDSWHSMILRQFGGREFNAVIIPSLTILATVAVAANAITIAPRRLLPKLSNADKIRQVELPFRFPPLLVRAYWDPSRSHGAIHRWFQQLLKELAEEETIPVAID